MRTTAVCRPWRLRVTLAAAAISATAAVGVAGAAAAPTPPNVPTSAAAVPASPDARPGIPRSRKAWRPRPSPRPTPRPGALSTPRRRRTGRWRSSSRSRSRSQAEGRLDAAERTAQRNRDRRRPAGRPRRSEGPQAPARSSGSTPFRCWRCTSIAPASAALKRSPKVAGVSEDRLVAAPAADAPQGTSSNANLADWWDFYRTSTNTSWANGYDGRGQTVAVLDTGVQRDHPWLSGKVVSRGAASRRRPPGSAASCPNYTSTQYGAGAAAPCVTFCNAHGTHVAGTAAGTNGVARGAGIIGIQVFHPEGAVARSYTSDQLKGLERVYNLRGSVLDRGGEPLDWQQDGLHGRVRQPQLGELLGSLRRCTG